jgi:hypothetical protein
MDMVKVVETLAFPNLQNPPHSGFIYSVKVGPSCLVPAQPGFQRVRFSA